MNNIKIEVEGVEKYQRKLNINKACGPDGIANKV